MLPGMNALLTKYEEAGVVGLGFPCNQFKKQEPGRPDEVMNCYEFVRPGDSWAPHNLYNIFGKVDVNGVSAHSLYKFLKASCPAVTENIGNRQLMYWDDIDARDVTWNYGKFLIDFTGKPRYRFGPTVTLDQLYPYVDELIQERDDMTK
uniref:glutathione peroxidase 3-like n=1 Tax=Styela clava TaxID=7725 RepID=UPI001939360F|nr:glutathione peroxidase 3-like [Styela clava]